MWCLFKKLRGYLLFLQMTQIPLVQLSRTRWLKGRATLGNLIFWIGIFTGPSLLCSLYLIIWSLLVHMGSFIGVEGSLRKMTVKWHTPDTMWIHSEIEKLIRVFGYLVDIIAMSSCDADWSHTSSISLSMLNRLLAAGVGVSYLLSRFTQCKCWIYFLSFLCFAAIV